MLLIFVLRFENWQKNCCYVKVVVFVLPQVDREFRPFCGLHNIWFGLLGCKWWGDRKCFTTSSAFKEVLDTLQSITFISCARKANTICTPKSYICVSNLKPRVEELLWQVLIFYTGIFKVSREIQHPNNTWYQCKVWKYFPVLGLRGKVLVAEGLQEWFLWDDTRRCFYVGQS